MIQIGRGSGKTVPLELLLKVIQDDLCQGCIVKQFSNRRCNNCHNNIIKQLVESLGDNNGKSM